MIEVERVYKSFDQPVLRGCSLRVERAEIVGLIGPPASGKSVLLRSIAGLENVDAGSIRLGGVEVVDANDQTLRSIRGQIGMLFQNVALFDHMSVFDNVAFPLRRLSSSSDDEIKGRVNAELSAVGLETLAERMPNGLSGGQKRRVGLARAAITRPRVLLYDEPAAGLDPVSTSRAFSLLREQRRRLGASILVVSSDVDRLLPAVDQVAMIHRGRIVYQGAPDQIGTSNQPVISQFVEGRLDGPL